MIRRLALLSLLCGIAASPSVWAQVRVDPGALERLSASPSAPTPATPEKAETSRAARAHHRPVKPAPAHHPAPAAPSKPAAPVAIAPAAPPPATLAPPPALPAPRPLPAPVIPMVTGAAGDASSIPGGVRVTFGPGRSEMSPPTVAALHSFAQSVAQHPSIDINVYAYAAAAPDDPSTPRRLSLSRALAARAVLMSDDIASTRIYVHALGGTASSGPPDRVDVQLAGAPPASSFVPTAPPPASSPPALSPPGPQTAPRTP